MKLWLLSFLTLGLALALPPAWATLPENCPVDPRKVLDGLTEIAEKAKQRLAAIKNRADRIDRMINRAKDEKKLIPSEIREMKQAAAELRAETREAEAVLLEKRVAKHEAKFNPPNKLKKLTAEQEALVTQNVIIVPSAERQIKALDTDALYIFKNRAMREIAENPRTAGESYRMAGKKKLIDGMPISKYKKYKFSSGNEYRVVYHVDENGKAVIDAVGPRESVYSGKFDTLD